MSSTSKPPQLSRDAQTLLVRLLARVDGLFTPYREAERPAWAHICCGMESYRLTGSIPWASSSADQAAAKQAERALHELVRERYVTRLKIRGVGQRTSDVVLCPIGFELAGELVGTVRRNDALLATAYVADISAELTGRRDCFVAEVEFSKPRGVGWGDGKQAEIAVTQQWQQAALVFGWTEFNCTVRRHGAYRATAAGLAAVDAATEDELRCIDPPETDAEMEAVYLAERDATVKTWRGKETRIAEIGRIPLSASGGPNLGGFAMSPPATEPPA